MSEFLSKSDLSQESRISVRGWERIIQRGEIPTFQIGRRRVVKRTDFDLFMESHRVAPATDIRDRLKLIASQALEKRKA